MIRRGDIYLVNFGKQYNSEFGKVRIAAREKLLQDSDICINELCTLDLSRIQQEVLLTTLTESEIKLVDERLCQHLGVG
jgi:mRNA interferase MazF